MDIYDKFIDVINNYNLSREGITEEIEEAKKGIEKAIKFAKSNSFPENCIFDWEKYMEILNNFKLLENCKKQLLKDVESKGFKVIEKNTMQDEVYLTLLKQTQDDYFIYTKIINIWSDAIISLLSTVADVKSESEIEKLTMGCNISIMQFLNNKENEISDFLKEEEEE